MRIRTSTTALLLAVLAGSANAPLRAAEAAPESPTAAASAADTDQTYDFFLQEAQVVTASRHAQKKSDSPVAIDVITKEDIAASGARTLWDVLRFHVGMDVADANSLEGNPAQVNVRGLPGEFSQSLQVLVDGRSVVAPNNSGVYWRDIPVGLEDIERIEIVRGPNAALFGANAGQGVINIITKKPEAGDSSVSFHGTYGDFGYREGQLAATLGSGPLRARISVDSSTIETFPDAQDGDSQNLTGEPKDLKGGLRLDADLWKNGELEVFAGFSQQDFNQPPTTSFVPDYSTGSYSGDYLMAQWHQKFGEHSLDLTLSDRNETIGFGPDTVDNNVYDGDALFHLSLLDGKLVTGLGASLRYSQSVSAALYDYGASGQQAAWGPQTVLYYGAFQVGQTTPFPGGTDTLVDHQRRLYWQENYAPVEWLTADVAASYEYSDTGGQWPAYQGALILKPMDNEQLRVSAGKSPTVPSLENVNGRIYFEGQGGNNTNLSVPNGALLGGFVVQGSQVATTQVSDYEATWSGQFFKHHLSAEVTGYDMEAENLIDVQADSPALANNYFGVAQGQAVYAQYGYGYANDNSIVARGTETVLTFKPVDGTTIQANHTYEDVQSSRKNINTWYTTPWNKANLIAQSQLPYGFNVSGQLGWVGGHYSYMVSTGNQEWIEDQATLDLRVGYKPVKYVEIFVVGSNLDHAYRVESADGAAQPRMYWAGLDLAWGTK